MPYWFDGNNLIGQSAEASRRDPRTREAFLRLLGSIAAERGGKFLVFFDGDDHARRMPPRGVRVRYCAPRSTDDAVVHEIEGTRLPKEITVVTNDRELAGRCRDAGASTMDWRRFLDGMSKNPGRRGGGTAREEEVNLKEWVEFFGLKSDELK